MTPRNDVRLPLPLTFAVASIRAEFSDMQRLNADCPVRSAVVQERLARVETLLETIEEHARRP